MLWVALFANVASAAVQAGLGHHTLAVVNGFMALITYLALTSLRRPPPKA